MKTLQFFKKTFLENLRDWKIIGMVFVFGPFFIFVMSAYFDAADPAFRMLLANNDQGNAVTRGLIETWENAEGENGKAVFHIASAQNRTDAAAKVEAGEAELFIEIPAGFGDSLTKEDNSAAPSFRSVSDQSSQRSAMAVSFCDYLAYTYAFSVTGEGAPLNIQYEFLSDRGSVSDLDAYIPALIVLAVILVLFTTGATIIREKEHRTIIRLTMSPVKTSSMMAAITVNQLIIALAALAISIGAAYLNGYRPAGNMLSIIPVGLLGALGVIAVGFATASILNNMFGLLTVGVFPFFILMFFSGCMFPLPQIPLVSILRHQFYLNDILPTSLTVRIFNQMLNHNATYAAMGVELSVLVTVTAAYFFLSLLLLKKRL